MGDARPDEALAYVLRRLPRLAGVIEVEFRRSPSFRSLCEDFLVCSDAAMRWQASDLPAAATRRQEYAQWLSELELEIVHWLDTGAGGATTGPGEGP